MLTSFTQKVTYVTIVTSLLCLSAAAQFRDFGQIYSENLKGGSVIFGNTMMNIVENNTVNLTKMNQIGDPNNNLGGIGYTQYGNDGQNMMFTDIDVTPPNLTVFNLGASGWKYLANGSNQGTAWRTLNNPGSPWVSGTASFGYGHSQTTTITGGHFTNYFLKNVTIADPTQYGSFNFIYSYDDGAVIYVNGVEVGRADMPSGTIAYNTAASGNNYQTGVSLSIPASYFSAGNNIIAVEIHQNTANSNDAYFDMSLAGVSLATKNSSSADLILPAGTNSIKFARLYWGGRISNSAITTTPDTLRKIKIRKGTSGAYSSATAPASNVNTYAISSTQKVYQSFVDVKAFIQANGAGTYTIADLAANEGSQSSGGNYAGWCIVVAYENLASNYTSVRIYDGYSMVFDDGTPVTQTITLTGLNVPNNPLANNEAVMATVAWEGDGNLGGSTANPHGDYLKVNDIYVSNNVNKAANFWNGSISKNGNYVTGTKNPDYYNQMGIDIDEVNVGTGYGILPNATEVKIDFGTEADQYFPSLFTFAIKMKDPVITLDKFVSDANNNGFVDANEVLTYTLSGTNMGPGVAYNSTVIDSLPANVTYLPNTLEVVSAPGCTAGIKTDANDADIAMKGNSGGRDYVKFFIGTGSSGSGGGQLPIGSTYELKFKVKAEAIPGSITNTARITANSQAGDQFIDDGTAVLSPDAGPVDVKLSSFTAKLANNNGLLTWVTEQEINNSYFDIERSDDAINFVKRAKVAGAGNSSSRLTYTYTDALNTSSKIVYYRLKMVDLDGKYAYSKIIAIKLNGTSTENFSVYPNPFVSNIKVRLSAQEDGMATFRILSFDGKEVMSRKVSVQKGENIVVLKDFDQLQKGNYILEVTTPTDKFINKIMKN